MANVLRNILVSSTGERLRFSLSCPFWFVCSLCATLLLPAVNLGLNMFTLAHSSS